VLPPRAVVGSASLEQVQAGAAVDADALIRELYPVVRKHLGFLLRFHPATEDAVQEAMVEIYRSVPRLRYRESVRAWALRIAGRKARRWLRYEGRHRSALTPDGLPPEILANVDYEGRDDLAKLVSLLGELSPKKREAFVMMEILEMSAREAAEALGTSTNTAASRCRHAKRELSEQFERTGAQP
jgi:RNA polymerase sigma-70 factor, ECF subfamily